MYDTMPLETLDKHSHAIWSKVQYIARSAPAKQKSVKYVMDKRLLEYVAYALENKSLAYQLGFLRAVIVTMMLSDSKNIDIFKRAVSKANEKANK